MNASVRTLPDAVAPASATRPGREVARPLALRPTTVLGWLTPRLSREAPVAPGIVRLVGIVVQDAAFTDPDTAARAAWIGDGSCPHQVMADHSGELDRFDVVVSVTWHDLGPEPIVVLVNP